MVFQVEEPLTFYSQALCNLQDTTKFKVIFIFNLLIQSAFDFLIDLEIQEISNVHICSAPYIPTESKNLRNFQYARIIQNF